MVKTRQKKDFDFSQLTLIGEGHYCKAYFLKDLDGTPCALKACTSDSQNCVDRGKLKLECERLAHFDHPNIIKLHAELWNEDEIIGPMLEFMPCGTIASAITTIKEKNGSVPFELKLRWLTDVAAGLAYMHENESVHKDVKAINVLLDANLTAKLGDLELTTRGPDSQATKNFVDKFPEDRHPMMAGTLTHMPPETFMNIDLLKGSNPSYDVYGFGITMFQVLSEHLPVYGPNVTKNEPLLREFVKGGNRPELELIKRLEGDGETELVRLVEFMQACWAANKFSGEQDSRDVRYYEGRPKMQDLAKELNDMYAPWKDRADKSAKRWKDAVTTKLASPTAHRSKPAAGGPGLHISVTYGGGDPFKRPERSWTTLNTVEEANKVLDLRKNNITLRDERAGLNDDQVYTLARMLGYDCRDLAKCLLIEDGELDSIHFDHSVFGLQEVNYRLLRRWQEKNENANCKWMATALLSLGRVDMIEVLT